LDSWPQNTQTLLSVLVYDFFKNANNIFVSKEPTTDPVQNVSSLHQIILIFRIHHKSFVYSCLAISPFLSGFITKILYAFHICPMHIHQTEIQHLKQIKIRFIYWQIQFYLHIQVNSALQSPCYVRMILLTLLV